MVYARRVLAALSDWLPLALLAGSLTLNVYLGAKLGGMPRVNGELVPGIRMPTLHALDPAGARTAVDWGRDGRPTVLYIFSPSCVWCRGIDDLVGGLPDPRKAQRGRRLAGYDLGRLPNRHRLVHLASIEVRADGTQNIGHKSKPFLVKASPSSSGADHS